MRAMAKDKKDRYETANELVNDLQALLDDPTHSTERAKITGPRKKLPKKSASRYVVWIGGVAVIIAAVAVTVKVMMGGSQAKPAGAVDAGVAPPPPVDAAPVAVDAAVPELQFVEIEIATTPPGATIIKDGIDVPGVTPLKIKFVKSSKRVELVAKLATYNDKLFSFDPLEVDATKPAGKPGKVDVTLEKPKAGVRPVQIVPPKQGSGNTTNNNGSQGSPIEGSTGFPQQRPGSNVPKKQ
jgi:hypothetical protein